jgi:hypothetical protein
VKITIFADVLMSNTSHKVYTSNIILNDVLIYFISLEKLLCCFFFLLFNVNHFLWTEFNLDKEFSRFLFSLQNFATNVSFYVFAAFVLSF